MTWNQRFQALLVGFVFTVALMAGCHILPAPNPGGAGGFTPATGGASAGGSLPIDVAGAPSVAGAAGAATGGFTATGGASVVIDWPDCAPASAKVQKVDIDALRRTLMPKRDKAIHRSVRASYTVLDLPDAFWAPLAPTLDQLNLGSCTGNAGIQVRVSRPWRWTGTLDPLQLEQLAVEVYGGATRRDQWTGSWPPDDTGSDSGSVMAEMRDRGLITGWTTVVTFEGLQRALQNGPCSMDSNWYTGMFTPDRCGQLAMTGAVEGGHATGAKAVQYSTKRVLFINSWGNDWGAKRKGQGGYFWLKFGDVQKLINEGADFQCPSAIRAGPANDNAIREVVGF